MDIPMDERHLSQLGANVARTAKISGSCRLRGEGRLTREALRRAAGCRDRLAVWADGKSDLPGALEWLLDNWYLAEQLGGQSVRCFLEERASLPCERRGGKKTAYVFILAKALSDSGALTGERFTIFVESAQKERPMTELELALFPQALCACLVRRLADLSLDLEERLMAGEAGEELSEGMKELFLSLHFFSSAPLGEMAVSLSRVERLLRQDPAGAYAGMDEKSREYYRHQVTRLAKKEGIGEEAVAKRVLELARSGEGRRRHIGWYLFRAPLGKTKRTPSGVLYVSAIVLPTLFLSLLAGFWFRVPFLAGLLLLPISDLVKGCVDLIATRLAPPRPVFRMALEEGIPPEGKTLCVVAALLTDGESGKELAQRLRDYRLANRDAGRELLFGILADLPDSRTPMGEAERERVNGVQREIDALNEEWGEGFFLFFRAPEYRPRDERYMGWERKRGALLELCRLLKGGRTALQVPAGDQRLLAGVRYVITLDSDTRLTVGAAKELTGAMLHPLNRPEIDRKRRIVTQGRAILQPRISVGLEGAGRSRFSQILAGRGGTDPYGSAVSDVYHDLFDQGSYTGKGIFDVEAFLLCLERRFPTERILSHDLLEGAYLHAGLMGDVELTDSVPGRVEAYFARENRWVRGDWQLLPWLGRWVKDQDGQRERSPISSVSRWKIFDNLRRSLSPVCTLLALLLGMCLSGPAFALSSGAAVLSIFSRLFLSGADLVFRGRMAKRVRYYSTVMEGLGAAALQALLQVLFLPYEAWTCISAIASALWRSFVSHRRMLAWVTAADEERRGGGGVVSCFGREWSSVLTGAVAVCFSLFPAGKALGLIWMLSPLFSWALSREIKRGKSIPPADRTFLLHQAGAIWQYFSDMLGREDNYLPPDNYQEQPETLPARRSSPTNMGMALLSVLSAVDLELLPKGTGTVLLEKMLSTMERLPKWKGHLFNWYDTASTGALYPRYVSTVDSGNLCACLIALREGLKEWGEAELARRCGALADEMDLSALYDPQKRLFYIGYDVEGEQFTKGWYDLMASEARLTSYVAVARGDVERRHWRKLGRMLLREGEHMGLASWTGTMFEYFMPHLLLPCEPDSLLYESLAFCLGAQRRRTAGTPAPWGISESCFYAFDAGRNYRYKAHGVQSLGLKRGLNEDLVIAPYASFLALLLAPGRAVKNLRRLRDMGLEGRYGLCEAADFTPSRQIGGRDFEPVWTYMAHHLGMSLIAIDNTLKNNVMQRRFMGNAAMGAYRELLQEKIPVRVQAMRREEYQQRGQGKRGGARFEREGKASSALPQLCHLLSNGEYSVLCTENGLTRSALGERLITRACLFEKDGPAGMRFYFRKKSGELYPLVTAGETEPLRVCSWRFTGKKARWEVAYPDLLALLEVEVAPREKGEQRSLELRWNGEGFLEGEVILYLEPVLAREEDHSAHPAFSKLFLESTPLASGAAFTRRSHGREDAGLTAALVWDGREVRFDTSRESALGRGGLRGLAQALEREGEENTGDVLDPCLLARFPVHLKWGERFSLRLSMACSSRPQEAEETARRLLHPAREREGCFLDGLLGRYDLKREDAMQAFQLMEQVLFPPEKGDEGWGEPAQEALWSYGISGDVPIVACPVERGDDPAGAAAALRACLILHACGARLDLVYLLREEGDYRRPLYTFLMAEIKRLGMEERVGCRGGIHLADVSQRGRERPILAAAEVIWHLGRAWPPRRERVAAPSESLQWLGVESDSPRERFLPDGAVTFFAGRRLPQVGWSHVLANAHMGMTVDETGCGHLWYGNAREDQLTPWCNDPLAVGGMEKLLLEIGRQRFSLFADGDGLDCRVTYGFGYAAWEKAFPGERRSRVTLFVSPEAPVRTALVELEGNWQGGKLFYEITPRMGPGSRWEKFCRVEERAGAVTLKNPWNRPFAGQEMQILSDPPWEGWKRCSGGELVFTFACAQHLRLSLACTAHPQEERAAEEIKRREAPALLASCTDWWKERVGGLICKTPVPEMDNYLNGWALYQVLACRLFARTSRYQCGGAYGFRDQLQDVCALLPFSPESAVEQILRACRSQYEEGDVQHWWHPTPETGISRGVRTGISDDLLWLPYALCEYLDKTGDEALLDEQAAYLRSAPLEAGEKSRYEPAERTKSLGSVYEHACRAIECHLRRGAGPHGLAKIGSGDWNDGFDRVGNEGRGESVWLTWFAAHVLSRFAAVAEKRGETDRGALWREKARDYLLAGEASWDGKWFLRGWFDDGSKLGSSQSRECRIDSIAQSWAVLAPLENRALTEEAVKNALRELTDSEDMVVKLLWPPFTGQGPDPGYIGGYPPGIRENGGQYTHGAVWLAMALYRLGMAEEGYEVLKRLLPSGRGEGYRAEPYVLSGDVSASPGHPGRGGWSWYTGAAGWYFRAATEELLGLKVREGLLFVEPRLPRDWPGYSAKWTGRGASILLKVERGEDKGLYLDGREIKGGIRLAECRGEHRVKRIL